MGGECGGALLRCGAIVSRWTEDRKLEEQPDNLLISAVLEAGTNMRSVVDCTNLNIFSRESRQMGTFASSIQIYMGDRSASETHSQLLKWIRKNAHSQGYKAVGLDGKADIDRHVTIGPLDKGPWLSFYDSAMSHSEAAESISKKLKATVVVISLNDSDVLQLYVYKNGIQVDQYDSYPEYSGEKLTKEQRALLKGNLEQWKELLLPGVKAAQLRKAWDSKPLFADDILIATAQSLGMDVNLVLATPDIESYEGITRLAFQLEETPDYRIKAEGPPKFQLHSYGDHLFVSEGDHVDIQMSVYNKGGAADGLLVVAMGEAIEQGFIEIESVRVLTHKNDGFETVDASFELTPIVADGKQVMVHLASLPDFRLPQGVVGGMNQYWGSNWHQASEANQKTSVSAYIKCKALKTGKSKITVGLVPTTNSSGQAMLRVAFDISPHSRRPLQSSDSMPSHYLRMMEHPRRLVSLVSLGLDQKASAEIAANAIEKWHKAIVSLGQGQYDVVVFSGAAERPHTKKVKADKFLNNKQWAECRKDLSTAPVVTATLPSGIVDPNGPPIDVGSGFTFGPGLFSSFHGAEHFSPHLGFWADLRASGTEGLEEILRAIIDEVMVDAAGYQAFIARWDWAPQAAVESTPYEISCGINGQCTTLHEWCSKFLRGVSQELWLGAPLLERLTSQQEIESVAILRQVGSGLHLTLKQDADLSKLESVLQPLLPSVQDWAEGMTLFYGRK